MPTLLEMALARVGNPDQCSGSVETRKRTIGQPATTAARKLQIDCPAPDDAKAWWERLQFHRDRRCKLGYDTVTADKLAAGEVLIEMHVTMTAADHHGPPMCAGCEQSLADKVINLGDGARVHDRDGHKCLISYGRKWRKKAADRLAQLGIEVPAELTEIQ